MKIYILELFFLDIWLHEQNKEAKGHLERQKITDEAEGRISFFV